MADENGLGIFGTPRELSLTLAVIHHGLSCLAKDSIPASTGTVLNTALEFENHIKAINPQTHVKPNNQNRNTHQHNRKGDSNGHTR